MSESLHLEGIVLKRWDYGEKDQIVSILTKEKGRLQGIAKGAKASRKRFGPALDLFCWIKVQIKEKSKSSLVFIEQAQAISNFPKIRSDYGAILMASGLLDMSHQIYHEGQADERAFHILLKSLSRLEREPLSTEIFWSFLLSSLHSTGLAPQVTQCVKCENKNLESLHHFDLLGGGMICEDCYYPSKIFLEVSQSLHSWMLNPSAALWSRLPQDERCLQELLMHHFKNQIHINPDWSRFLSD